jgi:hypothetical protein
VRSDPPGAVAGTASLDGACRALGWSGPATRVLDVEVLGVRLAVVARPDGAEVAARRAAGPPPLPDPHRMRRQADADPAFLTRPAPVHVAGAVAVRRTWRAARSAAGHFTAFGPRAVLMPAAACTPRVLLEADLAGIGVVATAGDAGGVRRLLPAAAAPPVPRTHVHRLVEEAVFAALVAAAPEQAPEWGVAAAGSEPLPVGEVARHLVARAGQGERLVLEGRGGALRLPGLPAQGTRR